MSLAAMLSRTMANVVRRLATKPAIMPIMRAFAPPSFAQCAVRTKVDYRSDCKSNVKPRCDPKKDLCGDGKKHKKKKGDKKKKKKRKSMWLNPECCLDPCPDILPRFDELYYRPSNKAKRVYTQTWVECPKVKIAKKKICCFENIKPPPFKRRPRKRHLKGKQVCDNVTKSKHLLPCRIPPKKGPCPKIMMPGCCGARDPPRCKKTRVKSKCRKICTPYPSFSECQKPKPRRKRPIECRCLDIPPLCEVWEEIRRRGERKGRG